MNFLHGTRDQWREESANGSTTARWSLASGKGEIENSLPFLEFFCFGNSDHHVQSRGVVLCGGINNTFKIEFDMVDANPSQVRLTYSTITAARGKKPRITAELSSWHCALCIVHCMITYNIGNNCTCTGATWYIHAASASICTLNIREQYKPRTCTLSVFCQKGNKNFHFGISSTS